MNFGNSQTSIQDYERTTYKQNFYSTPIKFSQQSQQPGCETSLKDLNVTFLSPSNYVNFGQNFTSSIDTPQTKVKTILKSEISPLKKSRRRECTPAYSPPHDRSEMKNYGSRVSELILNNAIFQENNEHLQFYTEKEEIFKKIKGNHLLNSINNGNFNLHHTLIKIEKIYNRIAHEFFYSFFEGFNKKNRDLFFTFLVI
jgi:hypothetical protein